jgi:hypothetical protein
MSISQVFLKGKDVYHLDDDIILYFCFPTLGVAVPLRPGNYFMFNALIPHCISSRCKLEDDVMCVSFYLKTAIVGMNDNNLSLTPKQSAIIHQLHSSKKKIFSSSYDYFLYSNLNQVISHSLHLILLPK